MDIGSKNGYPASALSNFPPHPFTFDGIVCSSMEGLLQSFKFKNPEMQVFVCSLVGFKAKTKGKNKNWYEYQTLYWQGIEYKRDSDDYQKLLDRAYQALYDCSDSFRRALVASGNATLTHSIGKSDMSRTILTEREFVSRLTKLRECGKL